MPEEKHKLQGIKYFRSVVFAGIWILACHFKNDFCFSRRYFWHKGLVVTWKKTSPCLSQSKIIFLQSQKLVVTNYVAILTERSCK